MTFSQNKYNDVLDKIIHYLSLEIDSTDRDHLILYGPGGEGKTTMLNELKSELEQAGYRIVDMVSSSTILDEFEDGPVASTSNDPYYSFTEYNFT